MVRLLARHPLLSFFVLAFVLSWIAVAPLLLSPGLPPEPFQALGAFAGPTLSALIVLAATRGRRAIGRFLARYLQWRAGLLWWLIALFGTLVVVTLTAAAIVGRQVIDRMLAEPGLVLSTYALTLVAGTVLGPLWEEPGWRGFALPRLQVRHGPLVGSLILGALWAGWHAPGYLGGWLAGSPLALLVSAVAFSVLMTWVYNHSRGSVLLMILMHASSNATLSLGGQVLPADLPAGVAFLVAGGWIPAIAYMLAALVVALATRGRLSYRAGGQELDLEGGAPPA